MDETGPNARASLSPASRVHYYRDWFWFSSKLILKTLYCVIASCIYDARASLSPASRVHYYRDWFWFSSKLIFKALYCVIASCIFQSSSENGRKTYVCVMIYLKTMWQVNWVDNSNAPMCSSTAWSDTILFQGSMASHFMEMECKVWWCYHDFCFISFLFGEGRRCLYYYISISSPLFIVHICGYRQCPKISLL